MTASVLVVIGVYEITMMNSKEVKRFKRGLGWIAFGILFEFGCRVWMSGNEAKIGCIPVIIGIYKCCRAIIWVIRGRDEKKI